MGSAARYRDGHAGSSRDGFKEKHVAAYEGNALYWTTSVGESLSQW